MVTQRLTLIVALIYIGLGVMGSIPVLHTPWPPDAPHLVVQNAFGYLLGIFPSNVLLSVLHLACGLWGVAAAGHVDRARSFARRMSVLYGGLAVMGLIPGLETLFGLLPLFGANIVLHALTAVVCAAIGWLPTLRAEDVPIAHEQGPAGPPSAMPLATPPIHGIPSRVTISSCPLHPLLIPFPIAYLVGVCVTDLAYWWTLMPWYAGDPLFWADASFWLLCAGLGTGALAALIGLVDFVTIGRVRAQAIGWGHGLGNTGVLGLTLVNLLLRWNHEVARLLPWGILLSASTMLLLIVTSWWGALLVFRYHIGVMSGGGGQRG